MRKTKIAGGANSPPREAHSEGNVRTSREMAPILSVRIDFDVDMRIGPGKIELLEKIGALGSITAAARAMNMSYRHAWLLVDELDSMFKTPVVERRVGGRSGGTACPTSVGFAIIARYRAAERAANAAAQPHLLALQLEVEQGVKSPSTQPIP